MIVNNHPQNIKAAMQYTANQAAGEEMFQCIGFNEEPMEVDSTAQIGKVKVFNREDNEASGFIKSSK